MHSVHFLFCVFLTNAPLKIIHKYLYSLLACISFYLSYVSVSFLCCLHFTRPGILHPWNLLKQNASLLKWLTSAPNDEFTPFSCVSLPYLSVFPSLLCRSFQALCFRHMCAIPKLFTDKYCSHFQAPSFNLSFTCIVLFPSLPPAHPHKASAF